MSVKKWMRILNKDAKRKKFKLPVISNRKKKAEAPIYFVGINFFYRHVTLVKTITQDKVTLVKESIDIQVTPNTSFETVLEDILEKVPSEFFENAKVSLALPSSLFDAERFSFPSLTGREMDLAIQNKLNTRPDYYNCKFDLENKSLLFFWIEKDRFNGILEKISTYNLDLEYVIPSQRVAANMRSLNLLDIQSYSFVIADLGWLNTNIYIYKDQKLESLRELPIGLQAIIEAINQVHMGDALEYMNSVDSFGVGDPDSLDEESEKVQNVLWPILEKISLELKKALFMIASNITSESDMPIEVLLLGEFTEMADCMVYLSRELGISVRTPSMNLHLFRVEKTKVSPIFMTYALAVASERKMVTPINLLPKKYVNRVQNRRKTIYLASGVTALIVAILLGVGYNQQQVLMTRSRINDLKELKLQLENQHASEAAKLAATRDESKNLLVFKDKEDNRILVERLLYFMNLYHPENIKIEKISVDKEVVKVEGLVYKPAISTVFSKYFSKIESLSAVKNIKVSLNNYNDHFSSYLFEIELNRGASKS